MKRATLRDVAERAGVSHQTVSRVINAQGLVTVATRERVLEAIAALDYVPNGVARSLAAKRTLTLGVSVADIGSYAVGQVIAGAEDTARRHDLALVIGTVGLPDDAPDGAAWRSHLSLMLQRGIDGLILAWPSLPIDAGATLEWVASRVPLVTLSSRPDLPGVGTVSIDNRRGATEATAFLVGQGHRAIATIAGPAHWRASVTRLEGYRTALDSAGLRCDPALVARGGGWEPGDGRLAAARLLDGGEPFTAVFAQSDLLALGAIGAFRARGLRIPEDVAVMGYDDIPVAAHLDPPLTTMRQPIREEGVRAATLLIDAIAGAPTPADRRLMLPATLVVRQSVAPPAVTGRSVVAQAPAASGATGFPAKASTSPSMPAAVTSAPAPGPETTHG